ncbi:hypothetical protein [Aliikangiella sp. G2MR2-5]|uniref:hypothetical protein n=1 Tax=Aliikangiella sp. G2MR2-5 TaxID=2788943 RepID=UPI0018AB9CBC|nr:hypothetical protein [Aliikangiella sp. G2MR2-5]
MKSSFTLFLPQASLAQLSQVGLSESEQLEFSPLQKDWQEYFAERIGYPQNELPWSRLRQDQFGQMSSKKMVCCCDPVIMQMTHRGAYMTGQSQLRLSANDAIRIVTRINEELMHEGEQINVIDQFAWLYTSEDNKKFEMPSIGALTGKDMFNFSYQGEDGKYFQQLSMEIQMLMKQMVDRGELESLPPETILHVHFYDPVNLGERQHIPFIKDKGQLLVSDNELMKSFAKNIFMSHSPVSEFFSWEKSTKSTPEIHDIYLICFESEREQYSDAIDSWYRWLENYPKDNLYLVCQDGVVRSKTKNSLLKRISSKVFAGN